MGFFAKLFDFFTAKKTQKNKELGKQAAGEEKEYRTLSAMEKKYHQALGGMLGKIGLLGFDEPGAAKFGLDKIYVDLNISQFADREMFEKIGVAGRQGTDKLPMEDVVMFTFHEHKRGVLLISGDPGSGKTTLCSRLFESCLEKNTYRKMGFKKAVIPLYFPLRDLDAEKNFSQNFAAWCNDRDCTLAEADFEKWFNNQQPVLLMLDGLDEISSFHKRQQACDRIAKLAGRTNCFIIVTSRRSAMQRESSADKLSLDFDHLHARLCDFDAEQKAVFLNKWFTAVRLREIPEAGQSAGKWQKQQKANAEKAAKTLLDYLQKTENKNLNELAGI
ncbi:MAG: NACHT domain-containing protein, partial [bacterium]